MTQGQVKTQHSRGSQASKCQGPTTPCSGDGRLGPPWDTDLGCSTGFFYLHSGAPATLDPSPHPRVSWCVLWCLPHPRLPAKQRPPTSAPPVWSSSLNTDCLTLTSGSHLDYAAPQRVPTYQYLPDSHPQESATTPGTLMV